MAINESLETAFSDYKKKYLEAINEACNIISAKMQREMIGGGWSVTDTQIVVTIDRERDEDWQKIASLLKPFLPGWAKKARSVLSGKHWEETFAACLEQQEIFSTFDPNSKEVYLKYAFKAQENQ